MQAVTQAYKESMKSELRERGHMKLNLGVINQKALENAEISDESSDELYLSDATELFTSYEGTPDYATLETNYFKVDGTMIFPPRENSGLSIEKTGWISKRVVNSSYPQILKITLPSVDVKKLTIDFGDNYPTNFQVIVNGEDVYITNDDGSVTVLGETIYTYIDPTDYSEIEIRGIELTPTADSTSTKYTFANYEGAISIITIIANRMKNSLNRLRVKYIGFGHTETFENAVLISSSLESSVSPISEEIPQYDFSVTFANYDKRFDLDNPNSVMQQFETGQIMSVWYGYETPEAEEIEWVRGGRFECSEWEADDSSATIRCVDVFRRLEDEYDNGVVNPSGETYYNLAVKIFEDLGIKKYVLADKLKKYKTVCPVPRVSHKEALQIIANACGCVLDQDRFGRISITERSQTPIDFKFERMDMLTSPKVYKEELVKDVRVSYSSYQKSSTKEVVYSEDFESVTEGQIITVYFDEPCVGLSATLNESSSTVTIQALSSYKALVTFGTTATNCTLEISGYKYNVVKQYEVASVNTEGKTITWDNPLISSKEVARECAFWLAEYHKRNYVYEYETRGNPELDCGDIVYQENDFRANMRVQLTDVTIGFNGAFSGYIKGRRIGE